MRDVECKIESRLLTSFFLDSLTEFVIQTYLQIACSVISHSSYCHIIVTHII